MKEYLLLGLLIVMLTGCDEIAQEAAVYKQNTDTEKVWVYTHVNVPFEGGKVDSYYYYSEVSKILYEKIKSNSVSDGFIGLNNVRYWGDDDLINEYAGPLYEGSMVFRIEHIVRMSLLKSEPKVGVGDEQFDKVEEAVEKETKENVVKPLKQKS